MGTRSGCRLAPAVKTCKLTSEAFGVQTRHECMNTCIRAWLQKLASSTGEAPVSIPGRAQKPYIEGRSRDKDARPYKDARFLGLEIDKFRERTNMDQKIHVMCDLALKCCDLAFECFYCTRICRKKVWIPCLKRKFGEQFMSISIHICI